MLYYVYNNDIGTHKDVTSVPLPTSGRHLTEMSFDNGTTWVDMQTVYTRNNSDEWRVPFSVRRTNAPGSTEIGFGFSNGNNVHGGFPQPQAGKMYLAVMDIRNSGAALVNTIWGTAPCLYTWTGQVTAQSGTRNDFPGTANQTAYTRVWGKVSGETGRFYLSFGATAGTTIRIDIKNYRQFDVTGWTDAQIQALATKENYDEVYLTLPNPFHGVSNMTEDKFIEMGGIIRNDTSLDGYEFFHNLAYNYVDL